MRIDIVSKEFPPSIYGGAGVHVAELTRVLASRVDVRVHAFGEPRDPDYHGARVLTYPNPPGFDAANGAVQTLATDLTILGDLEGADVIHSHTWYANLAGHLGKLLHQTPHVLSAHSLEPLRPWKAEQLGGGYALSSWAERTAYLGADAVIAVSDGMRRDILACYPDVDPAKVHTVHNGIDTQVWTPQTGTAALEKYGIDPDKPSVAFVGRITRQKGVPHLVKAAQDFDEDIQIILCAGAPDTPEIADETQALVDKLREGRGGVYWVTDMLPKEEIREIYSAADIFVCPSVYEPLGIVNLEAMACETAVVASDVGGIPEVVVDGETGTLVHYDKDDTETFEKDLAEAVNTLAADADLTKRYAQAGLARVKKEFTWDKIAQETVDIYKSLI